MLDPDPLRTRLDDSLIAIQRLEKKLRGLRNKGEATDGEVASVKQALAILRALAHGRGYPTVDIDRNSDARRSARRRNL